MAKFINAGGMRINPDHIHCYSPAGPDGKKSRINVGGVTDIYSIDPEELDKLLEKSDSLNREISGLSSSVTRLWELLRARLR